MSSKHSGSVPQRPQANSLPTSLLPKNKFGLIDNRDSEIFKKIKTEKETKLNTEAKDKRSALEIIDLLREENQKLRQELIDTKELGHFHVTEVRKLQEENARLTSTVEEIDGLDYLTAQERLIALKKEINLKMDALHQNFLSAQTLYNKHLTKLRRQIAKTKFEGSPSTPSRPRARSRGRLNRPQL